MNRDCKPFDNNAFIYPVASGVYSAREYKYIYMGNTGLATSIYYKNCNEGIMTVCDNVNLLSSANGYAFSPVSVSSGSEIFTFWSEYDGKWHIKSTHNHVIPKLDGDLFVYSACIDKFGALYLACELMHGYMKNDIMVISNKGKAWEVSNKLNSEGFFCKRPQIRAGEDGIYVVWDGYNGKGYDVLLNSYINEAWSGEMIVSDMNNWNLKPSISIDKNGKLWIAWLKNIDVIRDGVISKRNHVHMAVYDGEKITPVSNDEALRLNMGLLPVKRYFGYHGLRRNPQVSCCENGDIALFWEMQRGEDEVWENVENGYFLCMFYNGKRWSKTFLIQDGGNCFTIDSAEMIGDTIHYAYRGVRGTGVDIKFGSINVIDLMEFKLPQYDEWDAWKPLEEKEHEKNKGLYWGDLHCHSIYSPDAEGYPDELFFYARDRCGLDFCA
ncbi:MAG: hypothetical protein R3232_06810, partial [Clostridia bacterium]|nr:hypothetical protein [Clostridia bacterium]